MKNNKHIYVDRVKDFYTGMVYQYVLQSELLIIITYINVVPLSYIPIAGM